MVLTRILSAGAFLLCASQAFAQLGSVAPPAVTPPAIAPQDPANVPAVEESLVPDEAEKLDTAPSLEQQNDLPTSPDVESGTSEEATIAEPAIVDPATTPAERTEAMPNAITREAQPAPTANAPKQKDFSWRYRWHGGRWWYWMPNKTWMIWEGAQWTKYADYLARRDTQYRGPRFRGYSQPTDANGSYYNGPSSSGYRGTSPPRYYNEYRPTWQDDRFDYGPSNFGPGNENRARGYDYWPGWRGGPGFGSYNSPLNSGTFQGGLGAGAGGGIGAAAVAGS